MDDSVRLQHMLDAAKRIIVISRGKSRFEIENDESLPYALLGLFQILGEAARHVSDDLKQQHSEIDWKAIIGMRNILVHAYFDVDYDILYRVVQNNIPNLIGPLELLLDQFRLDL